jgi:hypothetical protein
MTAVVVAPGPSSLADLNVPRVIGIPARSDNYFGHPGTLPVDTHEGTPSRNRPNTLRSIPDSSCPPRGERCTTYFSKSLPYSMKETGAALWWKRTGYRRHFYECTETRSICTARSSCGVGAEITDTSWSGMRERTSLLICRSRNISDLPFCGFRA